MKKNKILIGLFLLGGMLLAEGCASSKGGCGCGTNINQVYRAPKRYH